MGVVLYFLLVRKQKATVGFSKKSFPFVGSVLLLIASFVSLYWGVVGVDGTMQGFNWGLLGTAGFVSFICGLVGTIMSWRRKNQALVLFTICAPLFANAAAIQYSFDAYQLTMPWIMVALSVAFSLISGLLIGNSDEQFIS